VRGGCSSAFLATIVSTIAGGCQPPVLAWVFVNLAKVRVLRNDSANLTQFYAVGIIGKVKTGLCPFFTEGRKRC